MSIMEVACRKAGINGTERRIRWPRQKGPRGTRIDCKTGFATGVVRGNGGGK